MITLQFLIIIICLLVGTRFGGMGLGLISGIGLFLLCFIFGLEPGKPPVEVMLTILAVIGCASVLQTAGGLNVMMQYAERLLRRHPQHITLLAPFTTWTLTFLCGTGHVVYTMFPIISDIAIKKGIRPERPMAVASVASQMAITASPVSVPVVPYGACAAVKIWIRTLNSRKKSKIQNNGPIFLAAPKRCSIRDSPSRLTGPQRSSLRLSPSSYSWGLLLIYALPLPMPKGY